MNAYLLECVVNLLCYAARSVNLILQGLDQASGNGPVLLQLLQQYFEYKAEQEGAVTAIVSSNYAASANPLKQLQEGPPLAASIGPETHTAPSEAPAATGVSVPSSASESTNQHHQHHSSLTSDDLDISEEQLKLTRQSQQEEEEYITAYVGIAWCCHQMLFCCLKLGQS